MIMMLNFKAKGDVNAVGGEARPNDGVINTRRGNAENWKAIQSQFSITV